MLSAGFVTDYIFTCLSEKYKVVLFLFTSFSATLALVLMITQHSWLIKEAPVKQNAIKQAYRVIKYAIKTKQPRQRRAFTYCEDELPSRIDFGMDKYGGPFTIEQVEDVKTCLRLIPIAIVGGALAGSLIISAYLRNKVNKTLTLLDKTRLDDESGSKTLTKCYHEASFTHIMYYFALILIILHEFFLYPLFHRTWCYPRILSLYKGLIGVLLHMARIFLLLAYEVVSRHNYIQNNGHNVTIDCLFHTTHGSLSESFDFRWMMIPDFLQSVSLMMIYLGTFEFLAAQVPYSIKGLMVGLALCSTFLFGAIWFVVSIPFNKKLSIWGTGTISCGFWYTLLLIVTQICCCVILIILTKWYKKRKRQDVLPNEHIFAENYYSY
jgi:peptide/histidine transporter 3/4